MKIGTIKRIKVNPKTDRGAIQFEDGSAYYINSLEQVRGLANLFRHGNPIGEAIKYKLSEERIDGEGIIEKFFTVN